MKIKPNTVLFVSIVAGFCALGLTACGDDETGSSSSSSSGSSSQTCCINGSFYECPSTGVSCPDDCDATPSRDSECP